MRRVLITFVFIALGYSAFVIAAEDKPSINSRQRLIAVESFPQLFVWTDTCNVYVLKDGDAAILIDLGDAGVLDHLTEIGVKHIEWVLFTGHHRELCQGYARLKNTGAKVAGPEGEQALFEKPSSFRKMKPSLTDPYTVHGASFVRPPVEAIHLDRAFNKVDTISWHGYEFSCVTTHGNSPFSMSYLIRHDKRLFAISGDVMCDGAKMYNYFDSEWDYSYGAGIYALEEAANILAEAAPDVMLPAHGPRIEDPKKQLAEYQEKLVRLNALILRTYHTVPYVPSDQDRISKPTAVPNVRIVSPHLFKIRGYNYIPNFCLVLSDSGHGLLIDCGRVGSSLLDESLSLMQQRLGLKQVDAVIITHMHGDHCTDVPHLREKWGAKVWTLDRIVDKFEHPERYDYAALIESYGVGVDRFHVDRGFKPGEKLHWEGFDFTIDHMPGQTDFALCVQGMIDGQLVAFTGDNIFGNPRDPKQNGHEAVCARNQAIPDEGYIVGAEYLSHLKPDLLMGGHSWVMDRPAEMIERYRKWSYDLRDALVSLSSEPDYRYGFDPFWVHAEPYRLTMPRGQSTEVQISVRNFHATPTPHRIELHLPTGFKADPPVIEATVAGNATQLFPVRLSAGKDAAVGVSIIGLDATVGGRRYGEWFDVMVEVK